jgi:protein TonB
MIAGTVEGNWYPDTERRRPGLSVAMAVSLTLHCACLAGVAWWPAGKANRPVPDLVSAVLIELVPDAPSVQSSTIASPNPPLMEPKEPEQAHVPVPASRVRVASTRAVSPESPHNIPSVLPPNRLIDIGPVPTPVSNGLVREAERPTPAVPQTSGGGTSVQIPDCPPDYRAAYLDNPRPAYPFSARKQGIEGRVILKVLVDAVGAVTAVFVLISSSHAGLDDAAIKAVRQWRFIPAQKNGEASAGEAIVPIEFRLSAT